MSDVNLLHVIDDQKFISSCEVTFSVQGVNNLYCTAEEFADKLEKVDSYDAIIVHFLRDPVIKTLYRSRPKDVVLVWFFWGADAFSMGKFHNQFLTPKSRGIRIKTAFQQSWLSGFKNVVKDLFPSTIDKTNEAISKKEVINYFDIVVPIIPEDYLLLEGKYSVKGRLFHLNYVTPSIELTNQTTPKGENILLGNSASFTNNHLDAIDRFSKWELNDRKLIIPLNYGNAHYATLISNYAKRLLGSKVVPLMEFLPFTEYSSLLSSCNVLVLNHYRQQALGNVIHGFMTGMRVCLPSRSPLYKFLIERGFVVTDFHEHAPNLHGLSISEVEINRNLCLEHFGADKQHQRVLELVSLIKHLQQEKR